MRRNTDAENAFGDIMPEATVHICPSRLGDIAMKITNRDDLGSKRVATVARTVVVTASSGATVVTACYVAVPLSSTVMVDAKITCICSAGTYASSGGSYWLQGTITGSAGSTAGDNTILRTLTPMATGNSLWAPSISAGAYGYHVAAITIVGCASVPTLWALDVTTLTILNSFST